MCPKEVRLRQIFHFTFNKTLIVHLNKYWINNTQDFKYQLYIVCFDIFKL